MKRTACGIAAAGFVILTGGDAHAQLATVTFPIGAREVGHEFADQEPFAIRNTVCNADNWSNQVDWNTGNGPQLVANTSTSAGPYCNGAPCVLAGTVQLYFPGFKYDVPGTYPITLRTTTHCYGTSGTEVLPHVGSVNVYAQIPVLDLSFSKDKVAAGDQVDLTITLTAPAPPSGTRVRLTPPTGAFQVASARQFVGIKNLREIAPAGPEPLPSLVTIPPLRTTHTLSLTVAANAGAGNATVTAVTTGPKRSATVVITK